MSEHTERAISAEARVFGFEPTPLTLTVLPRSTSWRAVRAGSLVGGGLVAAPVVALIPPHAAWALGSVATGGFLGWRKWVERFTLVDVDGDCPKCDSALELDAPTRLRPHSTLNCAECRHDLQVVLSDGAEI